MVAAVKTNVEHLLSKLFDFRGQTIDVSYQAIFTLKYSGIYDEEGNKININNLLTASQRRSVQFLLFTMAVNPNQADPKCKHNHTTFRAFVQPPIYVDGRYDSNN